MTLDQSDRSSEPLPQPPPPAASYAPGGGRRRPSRGLLVSVAGGTLVLAALWLAAYLLAGSEVPRGTTVLGVELGGLSRAEAVARLDAELGSRAHAPMRLKVGRDEYALPPAAAGIALDLEATVRAAGGRGTGPLGLVRTVLGGGEVDPVLDVDEARLDRAVHELARKADRELREGGIAFVGVRAEPVLPRPGRALRVAETGEAITRSYLRSTSAVELPAQQLVPMVSEAEVTRTLEEFARPAVAAPVTLVAGPARAEATPQLLASSLRFTPDDTGRLVPRLDARRLRATVLDEAQDLETPPTDATVRIVADRPEVVPERPGRVVDAPGLEAAVLGVLPRVEERVVTVPLTDQPARRTAARVAALGIREPISSFTQRFPYASYRVRNISTAASFVDGTLLEPGEAFSMNDAARERTAANGYVVGNIIDDGRLREDLGGGVSTITTAVWDAAFHAGLQRIEQRAHSFHIARYKPGLEATVAYGKLDLRFRNDTPYGVFLTAKSTGTSVTVTMWSTKQYDVASVFSPRYNVVPYDVAYDPEPGCVEQDGADGFDIDVTRIFRKDGVEVRRETFRTHYNPAAEIHCEEKPKRPLLPAGRKPPRATPAPQPSSPPAQPQPEESPSPGSPPQPSSPPSPSPSPSPS